MAYVILPKLLHPIEYRSVIKLVGKCTSMYFCGGKKTNRISRKERHDTETAKAHLPDMLLKKTFINLQQPVATGSLSEKIKLEQID